MELVPNSGATPEKLYVWLEACNYVERVEWQTTKTSQGNIGKHVSEQNIKVFPKVSPKQCMEFELTRNKHMSENAKCPHTRSVMFKDPPTDLLVHAWSILRDVCKGKELFPDKVDTWMTEVLLKYTGQEQEGAQEEMKTAPGSASAEPKRKRLSNDVSFEEEEEKEMLSECLGECIGSLTDVDEIKNESNDSFVEEEEYENQTNWKEVDCEGIDWGEASEQLCEEFDKHMSTDDDQLIRESAEVADIRDGMKCVEFVQALPEVVRNDTDDMSAMEEMQAFKEREQEFVRWRSVTGWAKDLNLVQELQDMRMFVNKNTTSVDLNVLLPGSAS